MKKLFIVLAVASLGFVACNNDSTTETTTEDSIKRADSIHQAWIKDSTDQAMKAADDAAALKAKALADSLHADSVKRKLIK